MDDEKHSLASSSDSEDNADEEPYHISPPTQIPVWLLDAVAALRQRYPHDDFGPQMNYEAIDTRTGIAIAPDSGEPLPPEGQNITYRHQPRLRCLDCLDRLYNTGPARTLGNFAVHLRSRGHLEAVTAMQRANDGGTERDDAESEGEHSHAVHDSHTPLKMVARKTAEELMENVHYTISRSATCNVTEADCTIPGDVREGMQNATDEQDRTAPSDSAFRHFAVRNRRPFLS